MTAWRWPVPGWNMWLIYTSRLWWTLILVLFIYDTSNNILFYINVLRCFIFFKIEKKSVFWKFLFYLIFSPQKAHLCSAGVPRKLHFSNKGFTRIKRVKTTGLRYKRPLFQPEDEGGTSLRNAGNFTSRHGVASQNIWIYSSTSVRTSDLTLYSLRVFGNNGELLLPKYLRYAASA
jgi:hypothetical protein